MVIKRRSGRAVNARASRAAGAAQSENSPVASYGYGGGSGNEKLRLRT